MDSEKQLLQKFASMVNCDENADENNLWEKVEEELLSKHSADILLAYDRFKKGYMSEEIEYWNKKMRLLKAKNATLKRKLYCKNTLMEAVTLLSSTYGRQRFEIKYKKSSTENAKRLRAKKRSARIIQSICKDQEDWSSDDEVVNAKPSNNINYEELMNEHQQKKLLMKSHPDLHTASISLADVLVRCNHHNLPRKNGKTKEIQKLGEEDDSGIKGKSTLQAPSPSLDNRSSDFSCNTFPKFDSFFSLIGFIFDNSKDNRCTQNELEERILWWQNDKTSDLCGWKILYPSWVPFLSFALAYMSGKGTSYQLSEFSPLLRTAGGVWFWTGPDYRNGSIISPLCNHWLDTLSLSMKSQSKEDAKTEENISPNTTSYVVCVSTSAEKEEFHRQEKERFAKPYKTYIYDMHGYKSIAAPVKGVYEEGNFETAKARGHVLLVPNRPAFVTLLSLVRDAVARLPNGKGTRAEVCLLLKDSQFLNENATDSQINGVVSGALDRLHAEKDPCVKFDPVRKVWLYLHRSRTIEEIEKLHMASGAAVLAKKLSSKPKAKPRKSVVAEEVANVEDVVKEATETREKKSFNVMQETADEMLLATQSIIGGEDQSDLFAAKPINQRSEPTARSDLTQKNRSSAQYVPLNVGGECNRNVDGLINSAPMFGVNNRKRYIEGHMSPSTVVSLDRKTNVEHGNRLLSNQWSDMPPSLMGAPPPLPSRMLSFEKSEGHMLNPYARRPDSHWQLPTKGFVSPVAPLKITLPGSIFPRHSSLQHDQNKNN